MISIQQARENLENNGEGLSDQQVAKIRDDVTALVEFIFDKWESDQKDIQKT